MLLLFISSNFSCVPFTVHIVSRITSFFLYSRSINSSFNSVNSKIKFSRDSTIIITVCIYMYISYSGI